MMVEAELAIVIALLIIIAALLYFSYVQLATSER